ncbi:MAG: hypothetical protein D6732_27220 [Methanobacteriota archaeon]|nr:MAG: hypothetical protein D6732_27220 [Euryarchaeota archaeon]
MDLNTEDFQDYLQRALKIRGKDTIFTPETVRAHKERLLNAWLTRQYILKGKKTLVLPSWAGDQLDPNSPLATSMAEIPIIANQNLRGFIALGDPDSTIEPLVDHRGGIIPKPNSYTLLFGTVVDNSPVYSSESGEVKVELHSDGYPIAFVEWKIDGDVLTYECGVLVDEEGNETLGVNVIRGFADHPLYMSISPFDQDGLTEIETIVYHPKEGLLDISGHPSIFLFSHPVEFLVLPIRQGHAGKWIGKSRSSENSVTCEAKFATWAASFPVRSKPQLNILLKGDLKEEIDTDDIEEKWEDEMENLPRLQTGNDEVDQLYYNSAIVLRLLTDVVNNVVTFGPGSQDVVWPQALYSETKALDRLGFDFVSDILNNCLDIVKDEEYLSDHEQFDALGSILFSISSHYHFTGDASWLGEKLPILKKITETIAKARVAKSKESTDEFLPPGFTPFFNKMFQEKHQLFVHNLWAYSAIKETGKLWGILGRKGEQEKMEREAEKIYDSLADVFARNFNEFGVLTAGPDMDENSLIFFNLAAIYPLRAFSKEFKPIADTYEHVWKNYVHQGGLMIHQPWNAYGTYYSMQLAQVCRTYLHFDRVQEIIDFLVKNKTNEQGWAEGISPTFKTGAVGNSPNGYAAAEFVNLILDLFVEETRGSDPILLKGMPTDWLTKGVKLEGLLMENGEMALLEAKLENDILHLKVHYNGPKSLIVFLPSQVKETPSSFEQVGPNEFKTQKKKFDLDFKLHQ